MNSKVKTKGKARRRFEFKWHLFNNADEKNLILPLVPSLNSTSLLCGQNPGESGVREWLNQASGLVLIHKNNNLVGFCFFTFPQGKIVYINALMISPEYQGEGLAGKTIRSIVTRYLKKRPWSLFGKLYLLFRTQNPHTYLMLHKRFLVYPPLTTQSFSPSHSLLRSVNDFAKKTWPWADLDEKTFVLKNAYSLNPSLSISPEKITWVPNEDINSLFKKRIDLGGDTLDSLVILAEMNLVRLLKRKKKHV